MPVETVEAIPPRLQPVMQAIVRVQMFTGTRPGELCQHRPTDIDMTAEGGRIAKFINGDYMALAPVLVDR